MPNDKKKVRVLIVDDQASIRALLVNIVSSMGAEVAGEASSGIEAITQYKNLLPHIVLMDINMPEMDGIAALKEIKNFSPDALVIMLTSQNDAAVIHECIDSGAQNFLLKESPPETIQQEIKNTWLAYKQSKSGG